MGVDGEDAWGEDGVKASGTLGLVTEALHWSSLTRVLTGVDPPVTSTGPGAPIQPQVSVPQHWHRPRPRFHGLSL